MKKGELVVIEGACDGIGKTTQYKLLCNHLRNDGVNVISHHFPSYGTFYGRIVEEYLKGSYGKIEDLSPYFVDSLYAMDRAITWNLYLKRYYEAGNFILLDRYSSSSLIYQSCLIDNLDMKREFIDYVYDYEHEKLGIGKADRVIFLYAPFELITSMRLGRQSNEGIQQDIHESNLDFMKKVYENGLFVCDYLKWDKIDCHYNQKMRSIESIHEDIYKLVRKK